MQLDPLEKGFVAGVVINIRRFRIFTWQSYLDLGQHYSAAIDCDTLPSYE